MGTGFRRMAPASEGGRYKGVEKSTARKRCATGSANCFAAVLGDGLHC